MTNQLIMSKLILIRQWTETGGNGGSSLPEVF